MVQKACKNTKPIKSISSSDIGIFTQNFIDHSIASWKGILEEKNLAAFGRVIFHTVLTFDAAFFEINFS